MAFSLEVEELVKRVDEYRSHYPISMQINLLYFSQKISLIGWMKSLLFIGRLRK